MIADAPKAAFFLRGGIGHRGWDDAGSVTRVIRLVVDGKVK